MPRVVMTYPDDGLYHGTNYVCLPIIKTVCGQSALLFGPNFLLISALLCSAGATYILQDTIINTAESYIQACAKVGPTCMIVGNCRSVKLSNTYIYLILFT